MLETNYNHEVNYANSMLDHIEGAITSFSQLQLSSSHFGVRYNTTSHTFEGISMLSKLWGRIDHTQMFTGYEEINQKLGGVKQILTKFYLTDVQISEFCERLIKIQDIISNNFQQGVNEIKRFNETLYRTQYNMEKREAEFEGQTKQLISNVCCNVDLICNYFDLISNWTSPTTSEETYSLPGIYLISTGNIFRRDDLKQIEKVSLLLEKNISEGGVSKEILMSFPENYTKLIKEGNVESIFSLGEKYLKKADKYELYFDAIGICLMQNKFELARAMNDKMPEGDLKSSAQEKIDCTEEEVDFAQIELLKVQQQILEKAGQKGLDTEKIREEMGLKTLFSIAKDLAIEGNDFAALLFADLLPEEQQKEIRALIYIEYKSPKSKTSSSESEDSDSDLDNFVFID